MSQIEFFEECGVCHELFTQDKILVAYIESMICKKCSNKPNDTIAIELAKEIKPLDMEDLRETLEVQFPTKNKTVKKNG